MADELLTVKETARRLKVHPETVRRWIRAGSLPAAKSGRGRWGIRPTDLEAWLTRPSAEELQRRAAAVEGILALREKLRGCGVTAREVMKESRRERERRDADRFDW